MVSFHIITLFPESFDSYINSSILKRAQAAGHIAIKRYNLREFADNKWNKIDDRPYGGGPGMVIYAQPVIRAVESIRSQVPSAKCRVVFFAPGGKQFTNTVAKSWVKKYTDIIFVCGHYEGIDARARKILRAEEYSIGPYVLTGGELPTLVVIDAISRQVEGVLGNELSVEEKRISSAQMYTRPDVFEYKGRKYRVPKVLLSGDHKKIDEWKKSTRNK